MTASCERLESLRSEGGDAFDGPGFRFIEGLLRRAGGLDGAAAARLSMRATQRLDAFEAEFSAARAEARVALEAVEAAESDPGGHVREAFELGDYRAVRRFAGRALRLAQDDGTQAARRRLARLARQVRARGIALPTELRDKLSSEVVRDARTARELGDQLARVLFRDAAEQARSSLLVARAADGLPEEVGPYNPAALSVQALGLMEAVSPAYLRAFLAGLEELATLRALPEPPRRKMRRR